MLNFFKLKNSYLPIFLIVTLVSFIFYLFVQLGTTLQINQPKTTTSVVEQVINGQKLKVELTYNSDNKIIGTRITE